jgi:hypothetical protein
MKKISLFAGLLASLSSFGQTFNSVGTTSTVATGEYNLTPSPVVSGAGFKTGAIWSHTKIDFNVAFKLTFESKFDVVWGTGGDGMCAVFKRDTGKSTLNLQRTGHRIGYYRDLTASDSAFAPFDNGSFAVELDTYPNGTPMNDDPANKDHVAIAKNGNSTPIAGGGPIPVLAAASSIEDNSYRTYTIRWTLPDTLTVSEGTNVLMKTNFNPTTIWTATEKASVTWGFIGSTGSHYSNQSIKNIVLTTYPTTGITELPGDKASLSLLPNPNDGTFTLFGDVATGATDVKIEVLDMAGKVVYSESAVVNNGHINKPIVLRNNAANGTYIVRMSDGNINEVARFVLER